LIFDPPVEAEEEDDGGDEVADRQINGAMVKKAALYDASREIVKASDWDGDRESEMGVIQCLTLLLRIDKRSKKRKILGSNIVLM
jgi:hypothetical protein